MPKKTTTPADEGICAAQKEAAAALREPELPDIQVEITHALSTPEGKLHAYAKMTIGGMLEVDGLRILDGKNGLFCSMPARKGSDGKYYPTARAMHDDFKGLINDTAVEAFHKHLQEQAMAEPPLEPEMSL